MHQVQARPAVQMGGIADTETAVFLKKKSTRNTRLTSLPDGQIAYAV
jgi:hypothetical protein